MTHRAIVKLGSVVVVVAAVVVVLRWESPHVREHEPALLGSHSSADEAAEPAKVLRRELDARPSHEARIEKRATLEELEALLGASVGEMSSGDENVARATIESLRDTSFQELRSHQAAHHENYSARIAAEEASLLRRALLWEAVSEALSRGNYWLGYDYPTRLPGETPDISYQALSVTKDGRPATAVFIIHKSQGWGDSFAQASEYFRGQLKFWLQEVAYGFNSLPDHERSALYRSYKSHVSTVGYGGLPAELAERFPFGVEVDEKTLIMRSPQ